MLQLLVFLERQDTGSDTAAHNALSYLFLANSTQFSELFYTLQWVCTVCS